MFLPYFFRKVKALVILINGVWQLSQCRKLQLHMTLKKLVSWLMHFFSRMQYQISLRYVYFSHKYFVILVWFTWNFDANFFVTFFLTFSNRLKMMRTRMKGTTELLLVLSFKDILDWREAVCLLLYLFLILEACHFVYHLHFFCFD